MFVGVSGAVGLQATVFSMQNVGNITRDPVGDDASQMHTSMNGARFMETAQARWILLCVALVIALASRLYFVFFEATDWWASDTFLYADQASKILEGIWPRGAPNGFPLLIAALMALFGDKWDLAAVLLNTAFSSVIVAIVYALALDRSKSAFIAFMAALVAALWPTQLIWVRVLYTEVPATFFLCCGLFLHWRRYDVLGAAFIGAALVIRPTFTPVVAVVAVALLLDNQRKRAFIITLISIAFLVAVQLPKSTPIPGMTGSFLAKNIILSNHSIAGESRASFEYRNETVPEALSIYFNLLIDDPIEFMSLRFGHFWELWGPWPDRLYGRRDGTPRSAFNNAILGLHFPLFILAVAGFFKKPDYLGLVLISPALIITLIHTGLFALTRYNCPTIPFLIVLAADFVGVLATRFAKRDASRSA